MVITELLVQWNSDKHKPFKGVLIDMEAYDKDPNNIGCMCAQGQVLHLIGGYSADQLMNIKQMDADKATAKLLGISCAHSILLRQINDQADGAPGIVLTHPEQVLGDQAQTVLAFWRHLDRMSVEQWAAAGAAARVAARAASWAAAREAAWAAAGSAAWAATGNAPGSAAWATNEIQGAAIMRAKGQAFYFLPLFGFADPQAII